jgi:murein DD-endopeptidase MepM/ murein hydrolase activator NlpD
MRRLLVLLLVIGLVVLALTRAEPFRPTAAIDSSVQVIGRATPIRIVAHDRGTGLAHIDVRLIPATGTPAVVASADYPALPEHWLTGGSGVHDATVEATIDAAAAGIPEGPGTLEVTVADHSWLARVRPAPRVTQAVTVDITPPTLELAPGEHVARLGGSECLVYRPGADAVRSGVEVGESFFPGVAGLFADGGLRVALFAVPHDTPADDRPVAVAYDAAGNRKRIDAGVEVRPRRFAEKTLQLSDDFLSRKVPDLLQAQGLDPGGDLVTGYLRINRDGRAATERRLRDICRESAPVPLWRDALVRLPNSAPLSGFADHRSYVYGGQVIDRQTHLGFDLASLRGSPVPAANNGRVVFTGPLGIYGNTVVLDHGLGLFSLYGHLSEMSVTAGQTVARGDTVGKTGDTGLAAGDHLHFSVMIHGVHVDPVEWWDAHWIQDHVESRLAAFPRAASDAGERATN